VPSRLIAYANKLFRITSGAKTETEVLLRENAPMFSLAPKGNGHPAGSACHPLHRLQRVDQQVAGPGFGYPGVPDEIPFGAGTGPFGAQGAGCGKRIIVRAQHTYNTSKDFWMLLGDRKDSCENGQ